MGPQQLLRIVLPMVSLVVIGLGGAFVYLGSDFGWFLVGFGVLDLVTLPLVLRTLSRASSRRETQKPVDPGAPADPTADPSYNPYARED